MSCKYCDKTIAKLAANDNYWMHIVKDSRGYSISVHGSASNKGLNKKIHYCPMCGEELKGNKR